MLVYIAVDVQPVTGEPKRNYQEVMDDLTGEIEHAIDVYRGSTASAHNVNVLTIDRTLSDFSAAVKARPSR